MKDEGLKIGRSARVVVEKLKEMEHEVSAHGHRFIHEIGVYGVGVGGGERGFSPLKNSTRRNSGLCSGYVINKR